MEVADSDRGNGGGSGALEKLTTKLSGFISDAHNIKTSQFVLSVASLCYMDTDLAYWVWVEMFPKMWAVLSESQRTVSVCVCVLGAYVCVCVCTHLWCHWIGITANPPPSPLCPK